MSLRAILTTLVWNPFSLIRAKTRLGGSLALPHAYLSRTKLLLNQKFAKIPVYLNFLLDYD